MTVATWLSFANVWELSPTADDTLTLLSLPAIFVGVAVSGNVHQPSEAVTYSAIFLQWGVVGAAVAWVALRAKDTGDA
jgi:hypothetical protein